MDIFSLLTTLVLLRHQSCVYAKFQQNDLDLTSIPHAEISPAEVEINLKTNLLTSLGANEFSVYTQLSELYLSSNKISSVANSAFDGTVLEILDLSKNKLSSFLASQGVTTTLIELTLTDNDITNIDSVVGTLSSIISLKLAKNKIESSNVADISGATTLEILDVSENLLDTVPPSFASLPNLEELYLDKNLITAIPDVSSLNNLIKLDLGYNDLTTVHASVGTLGMLEVLNLNSNELTQLPSLNGLKNLTSLNIEKTSISVFPDFAGITGIVTLKLSSGNLSYIDSASLSHLYNLESLYLAKNKITEFPDINLLNMSLNYLDLSSNEITYVSESGLNVLSNLATLKLQNNQLEDFPRNLSGLANSLTTLDLSYNKFNGTELEGLSYLVKIKTLKLIGNPMIAWPDFSNVGNYSSSYATSLVLDNIASLPPLEDCTFCHFKTVSFRSSNLEDYPDLSSCKGHSQIYSLDLTSNVIGPSANAPKLHYMDTSMDITIKLTNNRLTDVPLFPSALKAAIAKLYVAKNSIKSISSSAMAGWNGVSLMDLSDNDIATLPYGLLKGVIKLDLSDNRIQNIKAFDFGVALCEDSQLENLVLDKALTDMSGVQSLDFGLCIKNKPRVMQFRQIALPSQCACKWMWTKHVTQNCSVDWKLDGIPCSAPSWAEVGAGLKCEGHPKIIQVLDKHGTNHQGNDCTSKAKLSLLQDFDETTCYQIPPSTAFTFVLDRTTSVSDVSKVSRSEMTTINITTYNIDCSDSFHVSVYQEGSNQTAMCRFEDHELFYCELIDFTSISSEYNQCQFECDCRASRCLDKHTVFLRVANPKDGGICDVITLPS